MLYIFLCLLLSMFAFTHAIFYLIGILNLCTSSTQVFGALTPNYTSIVHNANITTNGTNNDIIVTVPLLRHLGLTRANFYTDVLTTRIYMWGVRLEIVRMSEDYEDCVYLNVQNGTDGTWAVFDPLQWHISNSTPYPKRWFMHQSTDYDDQLPHDFFESIMNVSLFVNRTTSSRCQNITFVNVTVRWSLEYYYSLFSMTTQKYYSGSMGNLPYNALRRDNTLMLDATITSMESETLWSDLFESSYREVDDDILFPKGWLCGRGLGNGTWIWECGPEEG
eukprot:PhF_6_TR12996/c0_g1_i3/m.20563